MCEIKIAQCCGTCIHSNKPKQPQEHEAHYMVAKTERWCYLNKCHTTRECVCDNYEIDNKKGGVPACKRVFKFNERAKRILKLMELMQENGIEELNTYGWNPRSYIIKNNWLYERHKWTYNQEEKYYDWLISSKENSFDDIEKDLLDDLNKKILSKGEK